MARIGLAWDLGAGRGHAVRIAALARRAQAQGHVPVLFGRNLRSLQQALKVPAELLPAPHNDWVPRDAAPASWADILWSECGLHDEAQAIAIARAWRDLLALARVDALLVDAAPLAHPAARALGLRPVAIGTGFLVPPPGPPWPVFRDWEPIDRARLAAREVAIAARLDAVDRALGAGARRDDARALFTFPAFDHYGARVDARYVGPMLGEGGIPAWPKGARRVLVYLQAGNDALPALHAALSARDDLGVVAYFGGAQPWSSTARMVVAAEPLDIAASLRQADLVIGHGGNLAVAAAVAGVPQLLLPVQAETFCTARRLVRLGAALMHHTAIDAAVLGASIARLLEEGDFARAAVRASAGCLLRDDGPLADEVLALAW